MGVIGDCSMFLLPFFQMEDRRGRGREREWINVPDREGRCSVVQEKGRKKGS